MSLFRKRQSPAPRSRDRVPPGQVLTEKWPVLHYGAVPYIRPEQWELRLFGEVEAEVRLSWEEFNRLPMEERANDIHCVTRWSRLDNQWRGVPVREIVRLARPRPEARFVMLHAYGGWTTNLPLPDFDREENLFATHHGGEPLSAEHGAPVRVVVPHLYFWKSAKWVTGVEFMTRDRLGFWERNGYHKRGDPWNEERHGSIFGF